MSLIQFPEGAPTNSPLPEISPPIIKAAFIAIINVKGYTNRERVLYKQLVCLQVFLDKRNWRKSVLFINGIC